MTTAIVDGDLASVAEYVTRRTGLSFGGARSSDMARRIRDAMERAGADSGRAYLALLEREPAIFDELMVGLTVAESYFFREARQLDMLRRTILPERRAARAPKGDLRLWSAGCATGQEAYTLAIILAEEEGLGDARILATDISRDALRIARAGEYSKWSLRAVDDRQREAYFRRIPTGYRVDERFARPISFRHLNLLDEDAAHPRGMDVILCRNVLIYFGPEAVARAGRVLAAALAPGGWLVTGASDPPFVDIDALVPTRTDAGLVYRRASGASLAPVSSSAEVPGRNARPAPRTVAPEHRRRERATPSQRIGPPPSWEAGTADDAARAVRTRGGAGDLDGAITTAADAIARFPMHAELRFLHAMALLEQGRPTESAASARAALYLEPQLVMGHLALARAQRALGQSEQARRSLRNAVRLLATMPPEAPVPLSDGESAGRLAAMVAAEPVAPGGAQQRRPSGAGRTREIRETTGR